MGERTGNDAYWCNITMEEYLGDLGRTSGSDLSDVAREPEKYGLRLRGKLVDRPTAAKSQGSLVHFLAAERGGPDLLRERFAFYPSRAEAMVPEMRIKPGTKTVKEATGRSVPQDASDAGARKSLNKQSDAGKKLHREFMDAHRGKVIVYPESQPKVQGMVRALREHPIASALLDGGEPEITGHWTCRVTGERMRIRPDILYRKPEHLHDLALRIPAYAEMLRHGLMVELKTVSMKGDERLDTNDANFVRRQASAGWARKDATLHDGWHEIEGSFAMLAWVIVEAREVGARASVVWSDPTNPVNGYYDLGRVGSSSWGIPGYIELARKAQALRRSGVFVADCVREPVLGWKLPRGLAEDLGREDITDMIEGIE